MPIRKQRGSSFTQADTRQPATGYDQHGRKWSLIIYHGMGSGSGGVVGMSHAFRAPWIPDYSAVRVNPLNTSEVFIDYRAILHSRRQAWEQQHLKAVEAARKLKRTTAPTRYDYDEEILNAIGGRQLKPLEPVIAAMQDNAWILGFTDVVDPRLEPFVKIKTPEESLLEKYDFGSAPPQDPAPWEVTENDPILTGEDKETIEAGRAKRSAAAAPPPSNTTDDEDDDELAFIEEMTDPQAVGGKTVPVGGGKGRSSGSGKTYRSARAAQARGRKTLADEDAEVAAG